MKLSVSVIEAVQIIAAQRQSVGKEHDIVNAEHNGEFDVNLGLRHKASESEEAPEPDCIVMSTVSTD